MSEIKTAVFSAEDFEINPLRTDISLDAQAAYQANLKLTAELTKYKNFYSAEAVTTRILSDRRDVLEAALNKIGILARSEHAYTSEFTERVRTIVDRALEPK